MLTFNVQASFLNSLEMSVELLMLVLILPLLPTILPSAFQKLPPSIKDKRVAEWSLVALAVGQLCLGFAPVAAVAIIGTYLPWKHPLFRTIAHNMSVP